MDISRGEMVEKELDAMIQRRARNGEVDSDEQEELWKKSVRAYTARRREKMRAAWCEHHQGQAARLRAVLEELIANHEEKAAKLMDIQPKGAA
jgi:broad specificity phosphatase PhoE